MMNLVVLGATGSIGVSTLDVIERHPERFSVVALTGHTRIDVLEQQCLRHRPAYAVMATSALAAALQKRLRAQGCNTQVLYGQQALEEVAALTQADAVMAAIVGGAGLAPTLAAARAGKRVLLANKEALVMAGQLFMNEMARGGGDLLPIDSEHNAIFQSLPPCRPGHRPAGVSKLMLTASGGPFRRHSLEALAQVTIADAVHHPNWSMGQKISVDSATMMNKGLEVIEAHWLFGMPAEDIQVVIHPQSIIHSMVAYDDGSVLSQMGNPDMRTPIAHALAWPERIKSGVAALDLVRLGQLNFEAPDLARFPCLDLAFQALRCGGDRAVVLNAANEIAVEAFLSGQIAFLAIADVVKQTLDSLAAVAIDNLEAVFEVDTQARHAARHALIHRVISVSAT
jgi:1-deoxy-D-xylulose-5-phosphate reductoisomerase